MNYQNSKAWPYIEARKIAERDITGRAVVFETGYGPSGIPTLGTFAEVARTTMVRRAYEDLMGYGRNSRTRLICFSDDADPLRRAPDNVPNKEMLKNYIGHSLTRVPDPFGKYESFAHHNNAALCHFLNRFGFDYEFVSSTEQYRSGRFNETLCLFGAHYDEVRNVIIPTLGSDRRATYSPFMPIDADTGFVHSAGVKSANGNGELIFDHPDFGQINSAYTSGTAKLQFKADWAMRWIALGVDYEMAGKDLIDSVKLSSVIARRLGYEPPAGMIYELFLDENGHKISKSRGNGLTIDQWLDYGSPESLMYYLFQAPSKAHKLHPGIVPKAMDDYFDARRRWPTQTPEQQLGNAATHIQITGVTQPPPVSYSLLLNTAITAVPKDPAALARYVEPYIAGLDPDSLPELNGMVTNVFSYYWDIMSHNVERRAPTDEEKAAIASLLFRLQNLPDHATAEEIQYEVYEVGKTYYTETELRQWFSMLYEVLIGQSSGPRFGHFAHLYGLAATRTLLRSVVDGAEVG